MDNTEATPVDIKELGKEAKAAMAGKGRGRWRSRRWKDLSAKQRSRIMVQGLVQMVLQAWTLWDLAHRPADRVNGNKRWWMLAAFVQPFGPLAYILFGRKN